MGRQDVRLGCGEPRIDEDKAYLESVRAEFQAEGIFAEAELAYGDPVKADRPLGNEKGCDLLAMSTHGHKLLGDILFGVTASRVQHAVTVPVLLLRSRMGRRQRRTRRSNRWNQRANCGRIHFANVLSRNSYIAFVAGSSFSPRLSFNWLCVVSLAPKTLAAMPASLSTAPRRKAWAIVSGLAVMWRSRNGGMPLSLAT